MEYIIITNNSKVYNIYKETNEVLFYQNKHLLDLLEIIREKIYSGHVLLSDPILSNIEIFENPYKSFAISKSHFFNELSQQGLFQKNMIDASIQIAKKLPFENKILSSDENRLEEYKFIDLNILIEFIKKFDNF